MVGVTRVTSVVCHLPATASSSRVIIPYGDVELMCPMSIDPSARFGGIGLNAVLSVPVRPAFAAVPSDELIERCQEAGMRRVFARGERFVFEGQRSGQVVLIGGGRVKVLAAGPDGHEVVLAIRGPGEIIGDLSAVAGSTASATVMAIDEVEATMLPPAAYLRILSSNPELMREQMLRLIVAWRDADAKLIEFATCSVERRLCRRLMALVGAHARTERDGSVVIGAPLSHSDLAGLAGTSLASVTCAP